MKLLGSYVLAAVAAMALNSSQGYAAGGVVAESTASVTGTLTVQIIQSALSRGLTAEALVAENRGLSLALAKSLIVAARNARESGLNQSDFAAFAQYAVDKTPNEVASLFMSGKLKSGVSPVELALAAEGTGRPSSRVSALPKARTANISDDALFFQNASPEVAREIRDMGPAGDALANRLGTFLQRAKRANCSTSCQGTAFQGAVRVVNLGVSKVYGEKALQFGERVFAGELSGEGITTDQLVAGYTSKVNAVTNAGQLNNTEAGKCIAGQHPSLMN